MTNTHININSADYRLAHKPAQPTREQEIAKIEQYLVEMAAFSFTCAYKCHEARLAQLQREMREAA